ncbi:Transposon Ty3-I Gag-Pol polyprotein [Araneus ventricosus]|nr:Transposon Ty3-I Gag-Pol polyprotein [Araneus ventricosus]
MSPKTEIYSSSYEHNSSNKLLDRVKNLEQQIAALCICTGARQRRRHNNYFRNRSRSRSNRMISIQKGNCVTSTFDLEANVFRRNINLLAVGIKNHKNIRKTQVCSDITAISSDDVVSTLNKFIKNSNLLLKYPEISRPNLFPKEIKHDVKHFIETNGQPIHAKARQLDPKRLAIAKEKFTFMLNNEIIRPSNSQWSIPLHLATKKDGSYRPCGDYRKLNAQTIPDRYPFPRLEDFHQILKETKLFSKIDLFKAYFQIPIAEEHKCKTAIITPFRLYEFNVMSFGLKNAPTIFQ